MVTAFYWCLMALAGLWSVSNAGQIPPRGGLGFVEVPSNALPRDVHARGVNQDLCTVWVGTWPWTECQTFVSDYRLSMDEFVDMNPSVDTDCYGWVGGAQYCVMMRNSPFALIWLSENIDANRLIARARHISTDGTCARGGNITCIGSEFGPCCGKGGRYV
jgi:hypothetical protein